jgi:putative ABC transport system permease protein
MSWVRRVIHLLESWVHRERRDRDLDDEVRYYFDILIERAMARGLSREDAVRAARIEFDGSEQVKQKVREARVGAGFEKTLQDARYAWRMLRKNPGFTWFAVLSIALGLGANAAIFSLVDGVLLKSMTYPEPERIVELWEKPPGGERNVISPANYLDWAKESRSFVAMAAETQNSVSYTGGGEPRSLPAGIVSAQYFEVFGIKAFLGRTFARDEDQAGKGNVVVLSHRVWQNLFGSDRNMIGRKMLLNGDRYTVIGVLPSNSEFDRRFEDIWIPLVFPSHVARDYHYLIAVARLKPSVTFRQAQGEMSSIAAHIAELYPAIKKGWGATVDRYVDRLVGPQLRLSLTVLMGAVIVVLLIGCANLANLLMARATLRSREIALRVALGAGRGRVVRMLLTESLLLSSGGALIGIGLAYGLVKWVEHVLPPFYFPAEASIALDGRVLLFLAALTILTSVAFGLAPALQASRGDSAESLKEGGRGSSTGSSKAQARNIFVGAQVAVAFMLLLGAGLLIRSFGHLINVDTGFDPAGVIGADFPIAEANPNSAKLIQYADQVIDAVHSVPGVHDAAIATQLPLRGWGDGMPFQLPGKKDQRFGSGFKIVTPSYFHTLGLRPLMGRLFDQHDSAGSPLVVVVNESFVKRYFPGTNPIGKQMLVERILPSRNGLGPQAAWEIVGVVADEKSNGLDSPDDVGAYASFLQNPVVGLTFVAKGDGNAQTLIRSVERAIWTVNKNQVLDHPMAIEEVKGESLASRRIPTVLLGGFGTLAMLLACSGIYGVLSYVTAGRTQELGIRAALGATRWGLVRMVVASGVIPVAAGIPVGLGCGIALTHWIRSMLFQTAPSDALTLTTVAFLFLVIGLLACFVPAWRASRLDPVAALRQE